MTVQTLTSNELTDDYRGSPRTDHGKLRFAFFSIDAAALAVAADVASVINLCELPQGPIRILPSLSRFKNSAFGAGALVDIGHRKYQNLDANTDGLTDAMIAENENALMNDMDCSVAGDSAAFSDVLKFDIFSKSGVTIFATIAGAAMPIGASLSGYIVYIQE